MARQHQIWSLADDIEHVLAHRNVHDWYVFEAASWALAERRMPADRRRELWREPLPAAELAGRLRTLPLFASVTVDELFRIVSASHQVRHDPGSTLLKEGTPPPNAFTDGFRWGFWVAAGIWSAGLLASLIFIRREEVAHPEAVELAAPQS